MLMKKKFQDLVTDNCYIIFMLLTFGSFAYGVPGFLRAMLWMLIVFVNLRYCKVKNTMDRIVFAYILGAFLSLSGMLIRPYPIDFFLKVFVV